MAKFNHDSRTSVNRQKKRRNQNILLGTLVIILLILIVVLVMNFKKQKVTEPENNNDISQIVNGETNNAEDHSEEENNNLNTSDSNDESNENENKSKDDNDNDDVEITEIETEDNNVEKAYIGNWEPVGTVQTGEHNTQFEEGSDDRNEIRKAIIGVTKLEKNELIEHWIGNNGPDKVIATVSDMPIENIFRVYLSWVDKEGWQVTKLEKLKEYSENVNDSVDISEEEVTKIEKDSE